MNKGHRVGIAGLGHIGRRHLARYREMGYEVHTADPRMRPGEAASLGSSGHFSDYGSLLEAAKPDMISVCLPSFMHRDCAIAAFAHGADVLMEKPFALDLADIDAMLAAGEAAGHRIMVAHVCRFMAQYIMAREMIESGTLGKPVYLNAWRNSATPVWAAGSWLGDGSASGGTVMDLQIHEVDLARWFLGPVCGAAMVRRQGGQFAGSAFYHVISNLAFDNGAAAVLEAGHLMPQGFPLASGYRLVFEGGLLECNMAGADTSMRLYEKNRTTDLTDALRTRSAGRDAYYDEIRHFIDCIDSGCEFSISPVDARSAVATVLELGRNEILPF